MKQCTEDNCTYPVFSKGKCKYHMERKPLNRGTKRLSSGRKTESPPDNKMGEFFFSIWNKRYHRSEVSNTSLGSEPLSTMFHHIIEKSDILYGELGKFDEENIILILPQEHESVHKDIYLYDEINKRRERLLEKYSCMIDREKQDGKCQ